MKELRQIAQNTGAFLPERTAAGESGDEDAIRQKLKRLRAALLEIDISAIDELSSELCGLQALSIAEEISQGVLLSDYDGVIEVIDTYLRQ